VYTISLLTVIYVNHLNYVVHIKIIEDF